MDINLIKQYVRSDVNVLDYIKKILDYRNLRTEQAYYSKLAYQYDYYKYADQCKEVRNAGDFDRSYWKSRITRLDQDRRSKHNNALTAFYKMQEIGKKFNLELLYDGEELSPQEITFYKHPERREEITNAMFSLLHCIEDSIIQTEKEEKLNNINNEMNSFNRQYNVKKSIMHDESKEEDGGIEFDLTSININDAENT